MPTSPLLATKLYAPPVRADAVARPRLVQRVDAGVAAGHVVLAAPAGFGKSTVAAQWFAEASMPAAWLSLEEDDREPLRFLASHCSKSRRLCSRTRLRRQSARKSSISCGGWPRPMWPC